MPPDGCLGAAVQRGCAISFFRGHTTMSTPPQRLDCRDRRGFVALVWSRSRPFCTAQSHFIYRILGGKLLRSTLRPQCRWEPIVPVENYEDAWSSQVIKHDIIPPCTCPQWPPLLMLPHTRGSTWGIRCWIKSQVRNVTWRTGTFIFISPQLLFLQRLTWQWELHPCTRLNFTIRVKVLESTTSLNEAFNPCLQYPIFSGLIFARRRPSHAASISLFHSPV